MTSWLDLILQAFDEGADTLMNVAFLLSWLSRNNGGIFDAARRLAGSLQEGRHANMQVFGLEDEFWAADSPGWQVPATACRVSGPDAFGFSSELRSAVSRAAPDLIHIHGLWMYPSLVNHLESWRKGRPYLISPHGMLDPWAVRNSAWKKRLAGMLFEYAHLKRASSLHALCEPEVDAIRAFGLKNPVHVIPNGIDLPDLSQTETNARSMAEKHTRTLLYLGRLHPKKGLENLLRAWDLARKHSRQGQEWELAIAGWDQSGYEARLRQQVEELGLDNTVRFLGPRFGAEKEKVYREADAFILPSLSEGLPMVVLEAWAYGLPVLMTPECNLPEGQKVGAAIEMAGEPESIARGLDSLFSMPETDRRVMGLQGRKLVQQKYAWQQVACQMAEIYRLQLR